MILYLTNATKEFEGKEIIINSDFIVSVFEGKDTEGVDAVFVYSSLGNTWQVKETVKEIYWELLK